MFRLPSLLYNLLKWTVFHKFDEGEIEPLIPTVLRCTWWMCCSTLWYNYVRYKSVNLQLCPTSIFLWSLKLRSERMTLLTIEKDSIPRTLFEYVATVGLFNEAGEFSLHSIKCKCRYINARINERMFWIFDVFDIFAVFPIVSFISVPIIGKQIQRIVWFNH